MKYTVEINITDGPRILYTERIEALSATELGARLFLMICKAEDAEREKLQEKVRFCELYHKDRDDDIPF